MNELEKIEVADKTLKNKYNSVSKNLIRIVGANLTSFVCLLLPIVLIGLIWTDFTVQIIGPPMWIDGAVTVVMFIIGEMMAMRLGSDGGKLDKEYLEAKGEFETLVTEINKIGTMLMGIFCEWQIDLELKQAFQYRLRMLRMTEKDYEEVKALPFDEIKKKYGKKKAKIIADMGALEPVELNEAILLYDGEVEMRGGVPMGATQYLRKKEIIISILFSCCFTGFLTVSLLPIMTEDASIARIIYTVFKVMMLLVRMADGYSRGAKAYNTIEVRCYKAKSNYLRQYVRFVEDKTYLKFGDKYGDVSCFVAAAETITENTATNEE
jgi:hypothetical protein